MQLNLDKSEALVVGGTSRQLRVMLVLHVTESMHDHHLTLERVIAAVMTDVIMQLSDHV